MTNLGWLLDGALKLWKKSFILPHRKLEITLPLAVTTFWTRRASKTDWSLLRKKLWIWTTEDRLNYFLIVVKMKYLHNTKPKQKHKKKWQVSTSAFTSYRDSFSLSSVRIRWLFLDGHQGRCFRRKHQVLSAVIGEIDFWIIESHQPHRGGDILPCQPQAPRDISLSRGGSIVMPKSAMISDSRGWLWWTNERCVLVLTCGREKNWFLISCLPRTSLFDQYNCDRRCQKLLGINVSVLALN